MLKVIWESCGWAGSGVWGWHVRALQCTGDGSRCQSSQPKLSTANSAARPWVPALTIFGLLIFRYSTSPSILAPERHLRPGRSSCTPKSAHDIPPRRSCLPVQPCKGLRPAANPRPSGLPQQPCWVMEYVMLDFFLWPVQLPLYLGLNGCHLANEPILMF